MSQGNRLCPYCNKTLKEKPYWRHIQSQHPREFETDKKTWTQLFKDYSTMGMNSQISILAICELFNKSEEEVRAYLKNAGVI
jgi:uncharacterized C2H2 Zn-finger protein